MGSSTPRVSVCVPSFEYGHFLGECLESVRSQDLTDIEVLIGDNRSTDDTPAVARGFTERDSRFRYVLHPENLGYVGNVRRLFGQARGDYVTVLGADDRYLRDDFLRTAVETLEAHPGSAFFHSAWEEVDADGAHLATTRYYDHAHVAPGREELKRLIALRYAWISSVVARGSVVREVGGYEDEYAYACDLGWFLKLCLAGDVAYSPTAFVTYRRHGGSISGSTDAATKLASYRRALELFRPHVQGDPELEAVWGETRALIEDHGRAASGAPGQLPWWDADGTAGHRSDLPEILATWRREQTPIVVYGAGMHTRELLAQGLLEGLEVLAFADRDPAYHSQELSGRPIVPPDAIPATGAQAVLISSRFYQDPILRALRETLPPGIRPVPMYGPPAAPDPTPPSA